MKNINSVIMTGALLLIAAGCSKSKVEVINEPQSQEDAWVNDLSLPVPIEFSAPSALSKATPSGPVEGTVMDDLDIGIFALAITDGQPETPSHSGPHTQIWNTSNAASVLLRNEHATTGTDGSITLDETKYYPIDSDYSYSFFGYYPYTETADIHTDYARILFSIGYTDILYAADHAQKFSAIQDLIGFNAEYIRWLKRTSNYYELHGPKLDFKHMLTSLKISAVIKNLGADEQGNIRIRSVKLKNAYNDAYLYVADNRSEGNLSGRIVGNRIGVIELKKNTAGAGEAENLVTDFSSVELGSENAYLSEFIVVSGQEYTFEVTFGIWDGEGFSNTVTKEYTISKNEPDTFRAGTRYNVLFELDQALNLELKYTLTNWVDNGTAITPVPVE